MERRYWDSFCFIAILNEEKPHSTNCNQIINLAKKGEVEIVISPLTITETVRPKGSPLPLPAATREKIGAFFDNDYIKLRVIDRKIARKALDLCWTANLHPRDALHTAVAIEENCDYLETTDNKMCRLTGIYGLAIRHPFVPGEQQDIEDDKKTGD